jgi:hypothetical protein
MTAAQKVSLPASSPVTPVNTTNAQGYGSQSSYTPVDYSMFENNIVVPANTTPGGGATSVAAPSSPAGGGETIHQPNAA